MDLGGANHEYSLIFEEYPIFDGPETFTETITFSPRIIRFGYSEPPGSTLRVSVTGRYKRPMMSSYTLRNEVPPKPLIFLSNPLSQVLALTTNLSRIFLPGPMVSRSLS